MESGKKMSGNETDSMEKQRPRIHVYMYIYIAASNFYDFHARAPAHLEIRFNSLNFKKLPPLPRRSALHPSSEFLLLFLPIRLVQPFTPPLRITSTPFSPWNEIAPLCTVQGQLLDRLLLSFRGNTLATTKNQPSAYPVEMRGVGPFAGCPYEQVGIRSYEMAGICRWNFGENCLGVTSVDEGS